MHAHTCTYMCPRVHMLLLFAENRNGRLGISGGFEAMKRSSPVAIHYVGLQTLINECPNKNIDVMALTRWSCWDKTGMNHTLTSKCTDVND